jgi:hypothetical protein
MTYAEFKAILAEKNLTIAQFLKDCGYHQAATGYWRAKDELPPKTEIMFNVWIRGK